MFKSTIFLVFLTIVVKNITAINDKKKAEIKSQLVQFGLQCMEDHPLTEDDISCFKDNTFPSGENAGCFVACVFKKIGIIDDKGILSHSNGLKYAEEVFEDATELKNIGEFLTACSRVNDEDVSDGERGCDRAKLAYNCLIENSETFGYKIDF